MLGPFGLALLVALGGSASPQAAGQERAIIPRIVVGPNILVSRDGNVPHVELMVTASPRRASDLLGGAMTFTRPTGGIACRTYSSTDGGVSWKTTEFAEQVEFGGGDPQVAYTAQGTALFVALTLNKNEKGKGCASMHIWRSENGGKTWLSPSEIPCDPSSWDHEQIVVDMTKGKYGGRIYIGALYGPYPEYIVGVFRSDDDGRTWTGPVDVANGGGTIGINDITPMVLSDGTVVFPYSDFEFLPDKRKAKGRIPVSTSWVALSTDGGVTFSGPRKVQTQVVDYDHPKEMSGFPKFAADSQSKDFKDRIYTVWEDFRLGNGRVLFSRSTDRGKSWSPPMPVDNGCPEAVHQWQPAVAVNKDGLVAVTWFDTRQSADGSQYDQYFAVSLDGGETFLPSARVSSASSNPKGPGNRLMTPNSMVHKGLFVLSMLSAAGWSAGGHYMGLAADKDGDFHPFWVDARSGTSEIYSARVKVEVPAKKGEGTKGEGSAPPPAPPETTAPPSRVETALSEKVELIFDPTSFDGGGNEVMVPVRLKNISTETIYPPIRLEFVGFGYGEKESKDEEEFWAKKKVTVVNASNGKPGEGAVFEFDRALAGTEGLEPGAQTNPVVLRFRLEDPFIAPSMRWKATGYVSSAP